MLPASLNQFQKNISDLKKYINLGIVAYESSIENLSKEDSLENASIKSFLDNYQEIRTFTKIMNYSAIVVTLYGTLERYLENVAKEYLTCLCKVIPFYNDLPEKIKNNHYEKSIELEKNIIKNDKYKQNTRKEIVDNLYSCSRDDSANGYQLNLDAYTQHSSNFWSRTIQEFFTDLGIEKINERIMGDQNFQDYLRQVDKWYPNQNEKIKEELQENKSLVLGIVDDWVRLRNEIAHGIEGTDNLIETNTFKIEYIDFIEQYVIALHSVLSAHISETLLPNEVKKKGMKIQKIYKVIKNSILCFQLEKNITLKKGTRLVAQSGNNKYFQGKIVMIQVDGQDREELSIDVGIGVDFKIKKNQTFYLLL